MRMTQLLLQTLREAPVEARTRGSQLLMRGGFLRPMGGGFAFLPPGTAVRERIERAVCGALRACGGQPVALPQVRFAEGENSVEKGAVAFRDRQGREMALSAAHHAAIAALAGGVIRSYRQLPVLLYERWQAFRDDDRALGGLLGAREGRVVDACGLHRDEREQAEGYAAVRGALWELLASWDLGAVDAISREDAAQRPVGHRAVFPVAGGDLTVARCAACGYAAELEAARVWREAPDPEPLLPMQDVATPDCKTIADLAAYLGVPPSRTAKAVFLIASLRGQGDRFVFAIVRGDTALHEGRLKAVLGAEALGAATEAEIRAAGAEPGYGSPVGLRGITVVADTLVARSPNLVAGANRPGYHTLNVNLGRDYQASIVAEIATAQEGSPCPGCGSPLALEQGIALAEAEQNCDPMSPAPIPTYLDSAGQSRPAALGCYRVYVDRALAALAERHNDALGLVWPAAVAPYHVHLMTVGRASREVNEVAEQVYARLLAVPIDVLFDDRDERAGVKFHDADLLGAPLRVAVGERGLQAGVVEVKARTEAEARPVPLDQLVPYIAAELEGAR